MECLFAYAILWAEGFYSMREYNQYLDQMFTETLHHEVLLELEECCDNFKDTLVLFNRYYEYETDDFDSYTFGKCLFKGLEIAYYSKQYNIVEFASRCYKIWKRLPSFLQDEHPFYILSYADDSLSWNDETQARTLYETIFDFYKDKKNE